MASALPSSHLIGPPSGAGRDRATPIIPGLRSIPVALPRGPARCGRAGIVAGVVENRRRETVDALQYLVWRRGPAAGFDLPYGPLKRSPRADSLRRPRLERLRKAASHQVLGAESERHLSVRARM